MEDPSTCAETLSQVPSKYTLDGTGFTKVTVALNIPTPVYNDYGNIGQTFLMCHDVSGGGEKLSGGAHVLLDAQLATAYVLQDRPEGVFVIGPYNSVMHCNLATLAGESAFGAFGFVFGFIPEIRTCMQKQARGTCFWLVDTQLREQQPQHTLEAHAGAMHLLICTILGLI
eukprot:5855369-Pleurochrysis_carterae.AAC.2